MLVSTNYNSRVCVTQHHCPLTRNKEKKSSFYPIISTNYSRNWGFWDVKNRFLWRSPSEIWQNILTQQSRNEEIGLVPFGKFYFKIIMCVCVCCNNRIRSLNKVSDWNMMWFPLNRQKMKVVQLGWFVCVCIIKQLNVDAEIMLYLFICWRSPIIHHRENGVVGKGRFSDEWENILCSSYFLVIKLMEYPVKLKRGWFQLLN